MTTTPTGTPPEPALLLGTEAIAAFLGVTPRQLRQLHAKGGSVPLFKLKQSGLVAARPESLREWLTREEAAALAGQGAEV